MTDRLIVRRGYIYYHFECTLFFFLAIVLSVVLRFTASDYPFGIFKLFLFSFNQLKTYFDLNLFLEVPEFVI